MNGTRIITYKFSENSVVGKDFRLYFPAKLADLPKAFDLPNISKGYFPYYLPSRQNLRYRGQIPSMEYFDLSRMNETELDRFYKYYNSYKNTEWAMHDVMSEYCFQVHCCVIYYLTTMTLQDCEILAQAFFKYLENFMLLTGLVFNCFDCCNTLASRFAFFRPYHVHEFQCNAILQNVTSSAQYSSPDGAV